MSTDTVVLGFTAACTVFIGIVLLLLVILGRFSEILQRRGIASAAIVLTGLMAVLWLVVVDNLVVRLFGLFLGAFLPLVFRAWRQNYGERLMKDMLLSLVCQLLIGVCDLGYELDSKLSVVLQMIRAFLICIIAGITAGSSEFEVIKSLVIQNSTSHKNKTELERKLQDPKYLEAFKKFLEKEAAAESIMFFQEARLVILQAREIIVKIEIGELDDATAQSFLNAAINQTKRLHKQFVKPGSEHEVNVSSKVRERFTREIELFQTHRALEYSAHKILSTICALFSEAVNEIIRLLAQDSYLRFKTNESSLVKRSSISLLGRIKQPDEPSLTAGRRGSGSRLKDSRLVDIPLSVVPKSAEV